jgi:hypothetical protein
MSALITGALGRMSVWGNIPMGESPTPTDFARLAGSA